MGGDVPNKAASVLRASDIDLSSSAGVQEVLRVLRGTPMVHDDYNQVRDLIFEYKRTGGDKEVEQKVISILQDAGIVATDNNAVAKEEATEESNEDTKDKETRVKTKEVKKLDPQSRLGNTRPKPTFGKSAHATSEQTSPEKKPIAEPEPVEKTEAQKEESAQPKAETKTASVETINEPEPETAVVSPKPDGASLKEETEEKTSAETAAPSTTYGNPLERIRKIKQEVNLKVGNPINLIDADNEVGREYMNALLAAMKTLNSGSSGEINLAMQRLEAAFTDVQKTIEEKSLTPDTGSTNESADSAISEKPVNDPAVQPKKDAVVQPASVSKQQVGMVEEDSSDADEMVDGYMNRKNPSGEVSETRATDDIESPFIPEEKPSQEEVGEEVPEQPAVSKLESMAPTGVGLPKDKLYDRGEESEEDSEVESKNQQAAPKANDTKTAPLQSVAKEKQLENIMHSNLRKEAEASKAQKEAEIASMDPIMVPEVTNGLKQLLSEWSLFKSSGIFGTGPNGIDHPLYKKLADLQMTSIVSGRFEGATPEVRQSITDYMNGWRYEEGIIHNHGETFEHYLRRVIKHILDEQKKDKSSQ